MAIKDVPFSVRDSAANTAIASGTFSIEDTTGAINFIDGNVRGVPIAGISDYNGATNSLSQQFQFSGPGSYYYDYAVGSVSFTAGGVNYNISGPGPIFPGMSRPPTTFSSSAGESTTAFFATATYQQSVCFAGGTRIRTTRGDVPVEDLRIGDQAVAAGGIRTIVWIGHRALAVSGGALPLDQQPVRIRAGAFGPGLPARDLRLSHGHPVLVGADANGEGGVLVPTMCLINGTSILREPATRVAYWHVELDAHDILLAEGLPAESYIDGGDRAFFSEASDHALRNPDFVAPGWNSRCRPVATDGAIVEAERARLDAVLAASLAQQCCWDEMPAESGGAYSDFCSVGGAFFASASSARRFSAATC